MKKIMLAVAILMTTTSILLGQAPPAKTSQKNPEERTEKMIAKMKTELDLSEEQISKLKPLVLRREQQRKEIQDKMNIAKDDARKVMKDSEEEFKKILTPEQYGKLKQMREHHQTKQNVKQR